ncbi:MAG: AAA family ATPase, partial [Deltaproteobacteria bacterium]|nr:AAA family ATPase [Deltaproteobacteria bacterium]
MALTNLAAERTGFVGRKGELSALRAAVEGDARLVTVCGPGGVGKTRLARELGRARLEAQPGGVWFCDVAEARSPEELASATARAVELPLDGEVSPDAAVTAWLAARGDVLLVLDNGEQLSADAREAVARWLAAAPDARVLCTSREPLGVEGERVFGLGPMTPADAAALFVDRGLPWDRRVAEAPQRGAVEAVVEHLERLPLAIELAAARLDLLSAAELLARLRERLDVAGVALPGGPARHATLTATIAWSWELLAPAEQRLLEGLSVFRGGFSLEATAALLGGEATALSLLGGLRRRSLLAVADGPRGESRYALPEAVRGFAATKLDASRGRAAAERAHADVLCALARAWTRAVDGPREPAALEHLAAERDNLLAVDERFAAGAAALAAEALLALHPLAVTRGPVDVHLP